MTSTSTSTPISNKNLLSTSSSNTLSSSALSHLPIGTTPLDNQVAGHTFQEGTNSIGLLKDERTKTVLKPAGKPVCGAREIGFYKSLEFSTNSDLIELKRLVPEFKGTERMKISDKETDFIRLEDLTYGMQKPCIIDIKVGKRTWDPEATLEKIQAEEEKYAECKKTLGLCIPGSQVYSIRNDDKLKRFSKDYGKQLNKSTFIDTIKLFINYDYGVCKELILQILKNLWDIKKWSLKQKTIKLYSSSILILYDAKRLKLCINNSTSKTTATAKLIHDYCYFSYNKQNILNGSMQHSGNTLLNTPTTFNSLPSEVNNYSSQNIINENHEILQNGSSTHYHHQLHYNHHQCHNNHQDPETSLTPSTTTQNPFARIKMIDFAHAFPSTDDTIDTNYLFGIENLVKIFEDILNEIPNDKQHLKREKM